MIKRGKLPHEIPLWVTQGARHFITINGRERYKCMLTDPHVADMLINGAIKYEQLGHWFVHLLVIMPDHIHAILTFNLDQGIRKTVSSWKGYQAKICGVRWQSDFFEHRLRNDDEYAEKACYMRMNPVRKGLVSTPEQWPYILDRVLR